MTDAAQPELMPFQAMEILARARALEAQGRSICHLELGEPGAPPAPRVLAAVAEALPQPQGYTNAKGMIELRRGLARHYARQHAVEVDPDLILATMGSSAGFILAFHTAFRPGARIAITRPGYPAYVNTLLGLGFAVEEIPVSAGNGWRLTGEAIAAAHARRPFDGLLFASPANPTGAAVDRAQLAEIVDTCARLGIRFISDEIYHGLDYRGPSVSALELTRDAIVINSFSKYWCMTGWRIGWMVLPDRLMRAAERLAQNLFISAPTPAQVAALAAFDAVPELEDNRQTYAKNRAILLEALAALGLDRMAPADGAFYIYIDISHLTDDAAAFARDMLDEIGVAATPGTDFDATRGNRYLRLSYARSTADIAEGARRLSAWPRLTKKL